MMQRRWWRPGLAPLAAALAASAASAVSCTQNAPESVDGLEVVIAADGLTAPSDFDDIRLKVGQQSGGGWNQLWDRDYIVPSQEATLPTTFTLLAGSEPREVLITATAFKGGASGNPVVQRVAQVQVPTDRMAVLYLVLAQICEGQVVVAGAEGEPTSKCLTGMSCQPSGPMAGQCGTNVIDPSTLPTYEAGISLDAGLAAALATIPLGSAEAGQDVQDTGPPPEGAAEAGPDAVPEDVPEAAPGDALGAAPETGSEAGGDDGGDAASTDAMSADAASADAASTDANPGDGGGEAAACTDACTSGTAQCAPSGATVQTCSAQTSGCTQWVDSMTCSGGAPVCLSGACVACSPGAAQCASGTQPQTCSSTGTWQNATACTSQTCVSGSCTGVCAPAQTQCASGIQPQSCDGNGAWKSGTVCPSSQSCASGACVTPPSCQASGAGTSQCGASTESCCTSPEVTGGTYFRTYDTAYLTTGPADGGWGDNADATTVTGFRLDKYPVTVGRFQQFVTAWNGGSGWVPPAGSGKHAHVNGGRGLADCGATGGYETGWVASDDSNLAPTSANLNCQSGYGTWGQSATLPINCVNWYEAYAFCIWDGGLLPSDAELGYAQAGGSQQRVYPWGSTGPGTANQYAIYGDGSGNCYYPSGSLAACTGVTNIAPVGTATLGAGLWGQLDLTGNVRQWNLDYDFNPYVNPCTDCAYLTPAVASRVIRGNDFSYPSSDLMPHYRSGANASQRDIHAGFRCSRAP
jgi:formylglycine-generating enzyme required for sulfatase activity